MKPQRIRLNVNHSSTGSFPINSKFYLSRKAGKRPAIFITPVLGGVDIIEQCFAYLLSLYGYNVFITDFMPALDLNACASDFNCHDKTYKRSIVGLEELAKFAIKLPSIDGEKLGLFGMSVGGIMTCLNIKVNPRFKAAVVIAGGGLHHVTLATSKNPVLSALKKLRKMKYHISSDEDYQMLMASHNEMDSVKVFRRAGPERILMFIATEDDHVPTSVQVETWKDLQKPKAFFLKMTHYKMVFSVPFTHFNNIRGFYQEKFYPKAQIN